jgi:hypothetical protein
MLFQPSPGRGEFLCLRMIPAAFNDRLVELVNAIPFRPFTICLTSNRQWRITSADQLELFVRGMSGAHCFKDSMHPDAPGQIVHCYFEPHEILAIETLNDHVAA